MVAAIHNVTLVRQRMEAKTRRNSVIGLITRGASPEVAILTPRLTK